MIDLKSNQKIKFCVLISILVLSSNSLFSQLNIDWEKNIGAYSFAITPNDSIVLFHTGDSVRFLDFKDGSLIKTLPSAKNMNEIRFTKDGSRFTYGNGNGGGLVGFMDFNSFNVIKEINVPDITCYQYIEDLNLIATAGSNFIKIIDENTGTIKHEFPITHTQNILFEYTNSICYSKTTNLIAYKSEFTENSIKNEEFVELRIIDTTGKTVFERETKVFSQKIAISNSGNYLAYFYRSDYNNNYRLKVLDLRQLTEIADFQVQYLNNDAAFYFTYDDKYIFVGYGQGVVIHNIENLKSTTLFGNSVSDNIASPKDYLKTLYLNIKDYGFYKFSLPTTSIKDEKHKHDLTINIIDNKLIITNPQNHQINTLTAYDILGRTYSLSANGNEVDVSGLTVGKYFLKVGLADGCFFDFSFVVE